MELVYKNLRRDEWKFITNKEIRTLKVNNSYFNGTVALMTILSVTEPKVIAYPDYQLTIAEVGYQWLQFAPKDEHWWLSVLYDNHGNLIESYFDITQKNDFADEDNPSFIDMRLDVTISKERGVNILDEDELMDALDEKLITIEEYHLAYEVAQNIIINYQKNEDKFYQFIEYYHNQLLK